MGLDGNCRMRLYWNFIVGGPNRIYAATTEDLAYGDLLTLRTIIVGHIERCKDGSWSAYRGLHNMYLGNEPNKKFAMELVGNAAQYGGCAGKRLNVFVKSSPDETDKALTPIAGPKGTARNAAVPISNKGS